MDKKLNKITNAQPPTNIASPTANHLFNSDWKTDKSIYFHLFSDYGIYSKYNPGAYTISSGSCAGGVDSEGGVGGGLENEEG